MSNYERRKITKTTNTTTYTYTELNPNKIYNNKGTLSKLKNKLNRKKKKTVKKTTKFEKAKPIHISQQNNINARSTNCTSPRLPQSYTNPTSPKSPPLHYSNHNNYNYNNYNNNNNNNQNLSRRSAPSIHLKNQLPQAQQPYIHPNKNRFQNNNNNNYQRNQSIYKPNQYKHIPINNNNNNYNQSAMNNYNSFQNKRVRHQSHGYIPSKGICKPLPNNINNINRIDRDQSVHSNYGKNYKAYQRPLPPNKYIPKQYNNTHINNNNIKNPINMHDALLWNSYIDEFKQEPTNIETFLKFLNTTKDININYTKAKNIFICYKGKGKINVNMNNKSLKIKQIQVVNKRDELKELQQSQIQKPALAMNSMSKSSSINSTHSVTDDKDLKLWIEENYFSDSLYNKLLNKHITFDTLKFIDINDLDPLCNELALIVSEKVRLKAAIKKLQNKCNKIYNNKPMDEVKNEGICDDEFIIENDSDNEQETMGGNTMNVNGENDENINMEGDNKNENNIVPFTNGFIEEDNDMYLPGSYNENNMEADVDNIDNEIILPGGYDEDNVESLISEGVYYQMDNLGVNEVRDWLETIEMSMYYDLLLKHGFDSMKMIKLIKTANDLEDIGIKMKAHQLKIITAIQNM